MGRWTQFDEDSYRLPEGMKRIGYDADTKVYTFRDRAGTLYRGAPGADYGTLTPIPSSNAAASSRPGAFASDSPQQASSDNPKERTSTFHDILPANRITATTSPVDKSPLSPRSPRFSDDGDRPSPRAQFADAVRRTALPKMQGVVDNLRRSLTTTRHKGSPSEEDETLLRQGSRNLHRNSSMASTTRTGVSVDPPTPMSVNHRK